MPNAKKAFMKSLFVKNAINFILLVGLHLLKSNVNNKIDAFIIL